MITPSPRTIPDSWRMVTTRLEKGLRTRTLPKDLLIVGAAGTGKTFGILDWLHCYCRDNANLRVLFCRAQKSSLSESVLVTYEQEILARRGCESIAAGVQRRVRQVYRYPSGSEIVAGGLDKDTKLLSTAWDIVYLNEAIEANEEAWETLKARLGRPGRRMRFGLLIGDTNPGPESHWLKARCDAGHTALWDTSHEANPAMFDGRAWTPAGRAYLAGLDRLTGTRKLRLRYGRWVAGEGAWFPDFDRKKHVSADAAFDPALPVHVAVDCGTSQHTGAVFFQLRRSPDRVTVFGDYHSAEGFSRANAERIKAKVHALAGGRLDTVRLDPAASARTGVGPAAFAEYEAVFGRRALSYWPTHGVADGLDLVESFVAVDPPQLAIHPDAGHLIAAFENYVRAKRGGQWAGYPEDPQHPHEDLMDALRGGLVDRFPAGRRPPSNTPRIRASRVF